MKYVRSVIRVLEHVGDLDGERSYLLEHVRALQSCEEWRYNKKVLFQLGTIAFNFDAKF